MLKNTFAASLCIRREAKAGTASRRSGLRHRSIAVFIADVHLLAFSKTNQVLGRQECRL